MRVRGTILPLPSHLPLFLLAFISPSLFSSCSSLFFCCPSPFPSAPLCSSLLLSAPLCSSLFLSVPHSPQPFGQTQSDLKSKHIIQSATHVLLSGTSAGGQAVLFLCDRIAAAFPEAATKCVCDSGFFIAVVSGLPPGNTATNPICRSHHCLSHTLLPSYRKGGIHMARPYSKDWKGGNTWRDTIKSTAAHEASHERSHTLLEH
ncbi:unnamed protein product [Closterium sp. NIES-65]|nr:unnamed protein product [Closterium sp. NIES-65]